MFSKFIPDTGQQVSGMKMAEKTVRTASRGSSFPARASEARSARSPILLSSRLGHRGRPEVDQRAVHMLLCITVLEERLVRRTQGLHSGKLVADHHSQRSRRVRRPMISSSRPVSGSRSHAVFHGKDRSSEVGGVLQTRQGQTDHHRGCERRNAPVGEPGFRILQLVPPLQTSRGLWCTVSRRFSLQMTATCSTSNPVPSSQRRDHEEYFTLQG